LVGTRPFVDLARLELSTAGLKETRMAVFGTVLGDVAKERVEARARQMAGEIAELLGGAR
jgi:hypothetical protein